MNLTLPVVLALMGFVFSTRTFIKGYNKLSPYGGLAVYYLILFLTVWALQTLGLVVAGQPFTDLRHNIGTILVVFAFFITIDWESCWVNQVTKGNCSEVSQVYFMSEDGAVYDLWSKVVKSPEKVRILTYVVTPFILSLIGVFLLQEHLPKL